LTRTRSWHPGRGSFEGRFFATKKHKSSKTVESI
jgi:hypothetical protein